MIITTARKPSSKTRTFCRHLSRFTGCEYVPRGKSSLCALGDKPFLVVGDYRGNPGSFGFFIERKCVLSIRANVSLDTDIDPGTEPVIQGETDLALALGKVTGFNTGKTGERIIRVDDRIEFTDKGVTLIALTVMGIRGELIVRSV